jgi:small subunit ribosomal protein S16
MSIGLARQGCANRPFYLIAVMKRRVPHGANRIIEQIGSFDPMPNRHNEKLVGINFERLRYWLSRDVELTPPVAELMGLSGFLPIHPMTYIKSKRNRAAAAAAASTSAEITSDAGKTKLESDSTPNS